MATDKRRARPGAYLALHVAQGLSPAARRVGGGLLLFIEEGIDNPDVRQLAHVLAVSTSTVRRGLADITAGEGRLFQREQRPSKRAFYHPQWGRFAEILRDYRRRKRACDLREALSEA